MNHLVVYTIGHSNRPIDVFLDLLRTHGAEHVLDVRTVPKSRHNPQFNLDALPISLEAAGIAYSHLPELGGLRRPRADSPNAGWRNTSFRGYADYMQDSGFTTGVESVVKLAAEARCVLMCAESVPWRCHRSLIADALLVRGVPVEHIIDARGRKLHKLTPFAQVTGNQIIYPPSSLPETSASS